MAVPFDLQKLEITGDAVLVFEGIRAFDYAASDDGTLVYVLGSGQLGTRKLVLVDREGRTETLVDESRRESPRFSPDGQYLAVTRWGDFNVWVYEIARGISTPLTFEGYNTIR